MIPSINEIYHFVKCRSYPVTFFEIFAAYPDNRTKLRTRVCKLVKQGYLLKVGSDAYIVPEVYA